MKIPDEVRKAIGFVAYEDKQNSSIIPVGTFFFLGHDPIDGASTSSKMYAITARHVIDGLKMKGCEDLTLRLNAEKVGDPLITKSVKLDDWFFHPSNNSIDVAILEMGIPAGADHLVIPFSMCANDRIFMDQKLASVTRYSSAAYLDIISASIGISQSCRLAILRHSVRSESKPKHSARLMLYWSRHVRLVD